MGLPKDNYTQAYFSLATIKLALSKIYMKTSKNTQESLLNEKEYALASAKLIQ